MRDDEKDKWIGSDEFWEYSTNALRNVALKSGLKLTEVPGEAAFYGPKIDLKTKDAIGRTWQLSTVQVDPNLPERFELEYTDRDGQKKRPIMIHRALFGSIERFFAILLEHYAGAFPVWLSPVQVVGIPVAEEYADYLGEVIAQLKADGVRAELDHSDDRMQKKIRTHTTQKVPLLLIAGEQDRAGGTVSFRFRDGIAGERRADRRRRAPASSEADRVATRSSNTAEDFGLTVTDDAELIDAATLAGRAGRVPAAVDSAPDGVHQGGTRAAANDVPVLRGARHDRRGRAHRRPRTDRVRAAQPLPVQLRPPAGVPLPPHRHVRPGDRRRGRRDRRADPAGDARAADRCRAATASTWA